MNVAAIERMEAFAQQVLKLRPEAQTEFFREMVREGFMTSNDAEGLKQYVALYRMFTDNRYYKAVREAVQTLYEHETKTLSE